MIRGGLRRWTSRLVVSPPVPRLYARSLTSGTTPENTQNQPLEFPAYNKYEVQKDLRLGPRRQLEAVGIDLYPLRIKPLKVPKTTRAKTALSVYFSRQHVIHSWHLRYLEPNGHAYAWFFAKKYLEKHPEPLWWKPTSADAECKSVVRSKTKYRLKAAFLEALRRRGYDRTGRRLQQDEEQDVGNGTRGSKPEIACLYGTVDIRTNDSVMTMSVAWPDLLDWMERAVEAIESTLRRKESKVPNASLPAVSPRKARHSVRRVTSTGKDN